MGERISLVTQEEQVIENLAEPKVVTIPKISLWTLYGGNVLWLPVFALTGLGILFVYSASSVYAGTNFGNEFYFVKKQLIFLIPALLAGFLGALIPANFYLRHIKTFFVGSLIITLATHLPGLGRRVGGASRWLHVGSVSIQPAEFLKIFTLLFLVSILTVKTVPVKTRWTYALLLLMAPVAIILQKDLGTTVVVLAACAAILFMNGLAKRYFFTLGAFACTGLTLAILTEPYRIKRIMTFLNPFKDPLGSGFQIIQSFVAVANGGLFGRGIGESQQKLFFLPEAHTDFILAVIAEEMGFLGVFALAALYGILFYAILRLVLVGQDHRERLIATGVFAVFVITTIINMGVVAGALPTKGLPLPFISNGGSAIISNYFMIGLVSQFVYRNSRNLLQRTF